MRAFIRRFFLFCYSIIADYEDEAKWNQNEHCEYAGFRKLFCQVVLGGSICGKSNEFDRVNISL